MKRAWRRDGLADLERRLRDERPRPSEELVRRVAGESPARASLPRMRLGLAGAFSGVALAVVIALGGLGSPMDTAARIAQFDNAGHKSDGHGHKNGHGKPAHHQYDEKVTICHRPPGNPSNGQTLTLPRQGADAHLRNHRLDSRGPCPPPPPKPKPKPKPKGSDHSHNNGRH
jgi:hypothetical protein